MGLDDLLFPSPGYLGTIVTILDLDIPLCLSVEFTSSDCILHYIKPLSLYARIYCNIDMTVVFDKTQMVVLTNQNLGYNLPIKMVTSD